MLNDDVINQIIDEYSESEYVIVYTDLNDDVLEVVPYDYEPDDDDIEIDINDLDTVDYDINYTIIKINSDDEC